MNNQLLLHLAIFGFAVNMVACLKCFESSISYCGYSEGTDQETTDFCEVLNFTQAEQREISCDTSCLKIRADYEVDASGSTDVYFIKKGCSEDDNMGCKRGDDLSAETQGILESWGALGPGLNLRKSFECACTGDLCNSAISTIAGSLLLFLPVLALAVK